MLLAERSGTTWSERFLPAPRGFGFVDLQSISCGAPRSCIATGLGLDFKNGAQRQIAERLDGRTPIAIPMPKGDGGGLVTDVSCAGANHCVAVGASSPGSFIATLKGSTWTSVRVNSPGRHSQLELTAVSCPRSAGCVAAGTEISNHGTAIVGDFLRGDTWSKRQLAAFSAKAFQGTSSISCSAFGFCALSLTDLLISSRLSDSPDFFQNKIVTISGSSTSVSTVRRPLGSDNAQLFSISCLTQLGCIEVGSASYPNGSAVPLVATGR